MEVILTVEADDGATSKVSGTAETYEQALAEARKLTPEGSKAIVIRTDQY
ncbi:hypothetical protein [Arthrobacter sp. efr-133-R2A-63]|nr:hypothetical protein [Arthrobacter sp. efr-133-R2A-63]